MPLVSRQDDPPHLTSTADEDESHKLFLNAQRAPLRSTSTSTNSELIGPRAGLTTSSLMLRTLSAVVHARAKQAQCCIARATSTNAGKVG